MGRPRRSQLDLLQSDIQSRVFTCQEQQKKNHDCHAKERQFQEGDWVFACIFRSGPVWLPDVVAKVCGLVSYSMELEIRITVRHHVNHLQKRTSSVDSSSPEAEDPLPFKPPVDSESAPTVLPTSTAPSFTGGSAPQLTQCPVHRSRRHH